MCYNFRVKIQKEEKIKENEQKKLTDKQFQKVLALGTKASNTLKHKYGVDKGTAQEYVTEIFQDKYNKILDMYSDSQLNEQEVSKKIYFLFLDLMKTKQYFNIQKVTVKDPKLFRYSVNLNLACKEETDLSYLQETLRKNLLDIFHEDVSVKLKSLPKGLYECSVYGQTLKIWELQDELEHEVYDIFSQDFIVQALELKINKRPVLSIENNSTVVEYFDEEVFSTQDMKSVFYEYINDFGLNKNEESFINLVFSGYNPYNDTDIFTFQEAMKPEYEGHRGNKLSKNYISTRFFNKLVQKLKNETPFSEFEGKFS